MDFGPAGLFWTWRCMLHLLLNQVLFLIPTKVSGQHIPEGFLKETRVIVFIGAKGFLFLTTRWRFCLISKDPFLKF